MKTRPESLTTDTATLHKMVHDYQFTVDEMQAKIHWYEELFHLFKQRQFGGSSEKSSDQMDLFNEAESILDSLRPEEEDQETIPCQGKKPGRKPLSKHIPHETIRYELPESERVCQCGHALHEAGTESAEQLEIIPAQVKSLNMFR